MFGHILEERQQELLQDSYEGKKQLEEVRRLGTELFD